MHKSALLLGLLTPRGAGACNSAAHADPTPPSPGKKGIRRNLSIIIGTLYLGLLGMVTVATAEQGQNSQQGGQNSQQEGQNSQEDTCIIFPGDGQTGPALSYTDRPNGTFTDKNTGLQWEKKTTTPGSVHNVTNTYSWSNSAPAADGTLFHGFLSTLNNTCEGDETTTCTSNTTCKASGKGRCGFAGHRDWRIPTIKELQSIVDYSKFNPAASVPGETSSTSVGYWSSTTNVHFPFNAWFVSFGNGLVNFDFKGAGFSYTARAVRGDQ